MGTVGSLHILAVAIEKRFPSVNCSRTRFHSRKEKWARYGMMFWIRDQASKRTYVDGFRWRMRGIDKGSYRHKKLTRSRGQQMRGRIPGDLKRGLRAATGGASLGENPAQPAAGSFRRGVARFRALGRAPSRKSTGVAPASWRCSSAAQRIAFLEAKQRCR